MATAQGKQEIWFLLFPDRENTGNFVVTQGKFLEHKENIFDCIYYCKKHVSHHIFSNFLSLALLGILSTFKSLFLDAISASMFTFLLYFYITLVSKYQPNLVGQF